MAESTELGLLPSSLGGGQPQAPAPGGGLPPRPPMIPSGDDDGDEGDAISTEELALIVGPIYADAFQAAAQFYVGEPLELPEERAARRGKQLAVVLRKLGWADDEILCYAGLAAGVATDFMMLHQAKLQKEAEEKAREPVAPAASAAPAGDAS